MERRVNTHHVFLSFLDRTKPVRSIAFSPDGSFLLAASDDMHVYIYDMYVSQVTPLIRIIVIIL
jgi:WD40 repeat protein